MWDLRRSWPKACRAAGARTHSSSVVSLSQPLTLCLCPFSANIYFLSHWKLWGCFFPFICQREGRGYLKEVGVWCCLACRVTWQAWVGGAGRELPEPQQSLASHWSAALRQGTAHTHKHFTHGECFAYWQGVCVCVLKISWKWRKEVLSFVLDLCVCLLSRKKSLFLSPAVQTCNVTDVF